MKTSGTLKSFFIGIIIVLFAALIEVSIFSNITILPVVPDICLICLLYISLQNGTLIGETTGFLSGLFLDFLSACPPGLNCLYRTLFGYLGGLFCKSLNIDGIFISALLGFCATFVKMISLWLVSFFFPAIVASYSPFSWDFLIELGMNTVLTPILFQVLGLFRKHLVLNPEMIP